MGGAATGADIWWRIIRINGDGSIRMIYAGTGSTVPDINKENPVITVDGTNQFSYSTSSGDNMYVGFQYESGKRNGKYTGTSGSKSYAEEILEKWFAANLIDELNAGQIDKNAGFCADRTTYRREGEWGNYTFTRDDNLGTGTAETYYGAYIRNYMPGRDYVSSSNTATPTYICPDRANDLFTYTGSNKGTKSLTYPIGLITADELMYAGSSAVAAAYQGNDNFLYSYSLGYWSISPAYSNFMFNIPEYGGGSGIKSITNNYNIGFRPVINITPEVITTGTGTSDNPFRMS